MNDLTAFVAARLDEDERIAREAARCDGAWPHGKWSPGFFAPAEFPAELDDHIARHDPARVLREVAAGRAILAEHAATDWTAYGDHMCRRCVYSDDEPHDDLHHWLAWPCPTVRALAAIWSTHPGYRPQWAP